MSHHTDLSDAALKIFLAELRVAILRNGQVFFPRLDQQVRRVWVQGYITERDGDDIVDIDDGTEVMSLDVENLLRERPGVGEALQAGRYVSCVCKLEVHCELGGEAVLDLRAESVCTLDAPGDQLAEPYWWLEVAEAQQLRRSEGAGSR
mmetsp:Transcript_64197/g.184422  ORF Transcript_64197/g.184422 Transcript_64197/m.184422 type:complete len:149 (-) Transcript_64197:67-513(-)|eukprot:CAMPEP_0183400472 /NCGR_PEP_ID=MMETSP0370-20130417/12617_1 /TAXON_ID=268820 /ORGANISM="Peridinium aciculiferum, Strain PAER-2" /LENGTH=148 /DNA_ID=CAMNT_0025581777 /DNA_START=75 /DNA_END=521 /DNA_ORIENTATION=-